MSYPVQRPIRGLAALLMLSTAASAWGQARESDSNIVVTGTREQRAAVEGIEPERTVDEEGIASYGADTIGQVLDEISAEHGDGNEPVLFVNGRPITDPGDIVDYPAEAIERIDVLPRGAGARLGTSPDRRAYNVVLKRVFKSQIGTVRSQLATEGGWSSFGGELNLSRISGQRRLNLTLRARREDELLESERGLIQPMPLYPYALSGNVVADPGSGTSEIDPLLSAAAGRPVALAAIPEGATNPGLAAFVAGAGVPNTTDLGRFRTLRPEQKNYEAVLNVNRPVTEWLSAALTGRIDLNTYESQQGLRAALFILPDDNPFSPFGRPVAIARYFGNDALDGSTRFLRGNVGLAFSSAQGPWQLTLRGDYRYSRFSSASRRQRQSASSPVQLQGPGGPNPFAEDLGGLVPLYDDRSVSLTQDSSVQFLATGPLLELPAGPLRLNMSGGWRHVDQDSRSENPFLQTRRSLGRDELTAQGSLEIPILSRDAGFAAAFGNLSAVLDQAITDIGGRGTVRREGYALNWEPISDLRLQGSINRQRSVPEAKQLADPVTVTEGVRYFDVLRGETVDVTQVYGGNPDLHGERLLTRRISATAQVLPDNRLQLNAEYLETELSDPVSTLPPASAELLAAFPERFLRDNQGRLVLVDLRPVNFEHRSSQQLRWGAIFAAPLAEVPLPGTPGAARAPRPRLQFTLSHTVNLRDELLARAGFPVVDLLDGGAIGFAGGSTRHLADAALNLSDREVGIRLNTTWRSASRLNIGSPANPSQLRFSSLATVSLRTFADLGQVWPAEQWLKDTRVGLNFANVFNARQRVTDQSGLVPLRYQPAYRDPLGRTVEIELRKTF